MRNSITIAGRELRERIGSRSFWFLAIFGPLVVLLLTYMLFVIGGKEQQKWKVLVVDHKNVMDHKIMAKEDPNITYFFVNDVLEINDFAENEKFQKYDAMVEINEKVLANKTSFVFYREKPSMVMAMNIRYHVERRLEELIAEEYTDLSAAEFRKIKSPLQLNFKDCYDPMGVAMELSGYVGLFFGCIIVLFVFLFGMSVLRSVAREKSNRIVEVILASVHPSSLLLGKIVGIGLSAFVQFGLWMLIIGGGLYVMRTELFVDMFDPSNLSAQTSVAYNEFVSLVFERIQYQAILPYFIFFFVAGYLFYGAFFAALGAVSGSESDGQQFLLPLIALLLFSIYAGYYVVEHPSGTWTTVLSYLPFTAPVVMMVRLAQGFAPGEIIHLFLSLFITIIFALLVLMMAGKLMKNGLLQFGHSIRLRTIFTWLKMK